VRNSNLVLDAGAKSATDGFACSGLNTRYSNVNPGHSILRVYPNNQAVMRPSEKFKAKAAGQKGSEAWFTPR